MLFPDIWRCGREQLNYCLSEKKASEGRLFAQGEYHDQTFNVKRLISVTLRSLSMLPRY